MAESQASSVPLSRPIPFGWFSILLIADVMVLLFEKIAVEIVVPADISQFYLSWDFYGQLFSNGWLWAGLVSALVQLWSWLKILERTDLSLAYPVASLGYPLTMLAAHWFLGEAIAPQVWLGGSLITLGVVVIGMGPHSKDSKAEELTS